MLTRTLLIAAMAMGCVDYDLYDPSDDKTPDTGTAGEPEETASPNIVVYCTEDPECTSLYFGTLMQNCPSDWEQVTVENKGGETLHVSDIHVDSSADSNFILEEGISLPTLAPGETYTFSVQFTPTAVGTSYTPDLLVISDDPINPTASLGLEGTGGEYSWYEETFLQNFYDSVDVLWVLDNSGSMSDSINRVKDNYDTFINQFVTEELDFHMGVITTDMSTATDQGKLRGSPTYTSSDMSESEIIDTFMDTVNLILDRTGDGSEKGFDATEAALTEPLVSGHNAGFFRDFDDDGNEVAIATIIVSDENNDLMASIHESSSTTTFSDWYLGLKSSSDRVTFSAICGDPTWDSSLIFGGCENGNIDGDAGDEYVYAVNRTGGFWASICSSDFSEAIENLSQTAAGLRSSFTLKYTPTGSALDIVVEVNGVPVDYYSASTGNGWMLDYDTNSIVFYGDSVPEAGATVYVAYKYDAGC